MLQLTKKDKEDLLFAKNLLDNPGLAAKITNVIGSPIEDGINKLPYNWQNKVAKFTNTSLNKALNIALFTIDNKNKKSSEFFHKIAVGTSGILGGFGGLISLSLELPISTTIILRSIMDIARSEGEDINNYDTKLACIEVFALGGRSKDDDGTESGYFVVRTLLARQVNEAISHIASKGLSKESPILIKLITTIAEKFGVQVSQKIMAQAIPLLGAAGGLVINTIFINHFQNMARGHFIIRRLEKKYSKEFVESEYNNIINN